MGELYRNFVRPLLFRADAETAHNAVLGAMRVAQHSSRLRDLIRPQETFADAGLWTTFCGRGLRSPIGVAAGFDKNGEVYNALGALGFGFVEVGTVTEHPQVGNPRPRMFRLEDDHALINRMGFNNHGAEVVARRMLAAPADDVVVGVNIGKNKDVSSWDAALNYARCAQYFRAIVDYFVINVSSPNTPGLRSLQAVEQLRPIVEAVQDVVDGKPVLVKIAPDLNDEDIRAVAALVLDRKLAGVVATNTTIKRAGLFSSTEDIERCGAGGLSGMPVRHRALEVVQILREALGPEPTIVGVGGISTGDDVWRMLVAGANVVQAYTGFVYGGPTFARELHRALRSRVIVWGCDTLAEAIAAHREAQGARG